MWKKVSEELPPPNELVLLQLTGDEYVTGWYSPHLEVWFGNGKSPWRIEEGFVEKWCKIVRPYDAPDEDKLNERIAWLERRNQELTTILAQATGITSSS